MWNYWGWKECFRSCSFLLIGLLLSCRMQPVENVTFDWKNLPSIPPLTGEQIQYGVAGAVTGNLGGCILVAGGANFKDDLPWKGGIKQYHDDIYLLIKSTDGSLIWEIPDSKLPMKLAYSACISLDNRVVSIGGENGSGPVKDCFLVSLINGIVDVAKLPDLPVAISSGGAASIGSLVFLAGGLDINGASSGFFSLDVNTPDAGWQRLPDVPAAFSHGVVVEQNDDSGPCIYVIGGRSKTGEVSTFLSTTWKYPVKIGKWVNDPDIRIDGDTIGLSAGTGVAQGKHNIILFGGDRGTLFNHTERLNSAIVGAANEAEKEILINQRDSFLTNHPGFPRDILIYNTIRHKWSFGGEIPFEAPVTTTAFHWNGWVVIPSGEVRPGVRTPNVLGVKINNSK